MHDVRTMTRVAVKTGMILWIDHVIGTETYRAVLGLRPPADDETSQGFADLYRAKIHHTLVT